MTTANNKTAAYVFAGKGKAARTSALTQIAPLAFAEETSRATSLDNARKVLGTTPTEGLIAMVRLEYVVGLIASRLPASECLKGKVAPADRLALARDVVTRMGVPVEAGKTVRPLRKGLIGRRSTIQQRVMRNAESTAVLFFADLGIGKATGMKEKTQKAAAKRNPAPASGMGKAAAPTPTPPTHSQLVAAPKPETAQDVVTFLGQQSRMLADYINRHAKVCPVDASSAVLQFRTAIIAAANALQERKAIAEAAGAVPAPAAPAKARKAPKLVAVA